MMQFGMPTLIENHSLDENIALCKELGLSFIELNMNFPEYQLHKLEDIDTLRAKAQKAGIYYTIHLDENLNIADFNPLVANAYLVTVTQTIEIAKKLSVPMINMHMNHGIRITLPDKKVQMYDRDFDTYITAFHKFRQLCEKCIGDFDIRITIENTDGYYEYEKKAIDYLLDSPVFALTWDIGHSKAVGETDLPFLISRNQHLAHFHIHDGITEGAKNHLALGDGEIDIKERLHLAKEHHCRCVVETKTVTALRKSVNWLKVYEYM